MTSQEKAENARKNISKESRKKAGQTKTRNFRIKTIVGEAIENMLLSEDSKGTPQFETFIRNYMESAQNDPKSQAAQFFAERIIDKNILDTFEFFEKHRVTRIKMLIAGSMSGKGGKTVPAICRFGFPVALCGK